MKTHNIITVGHEWLDQGERNDDYHDICADCGLPMDTQEQATSECLGSPLAVIQKAVIELIEVWRPLPFIWDDRDKRELNDAIAVVHNTFVALYGEHYVSRLK